MVVSQAKFGDRVQIPGALAPLGVPLPLQRSGVPPPDKKILRLLYMQSCQSSAFYSSVTFVCILEHVNNRNGVPTRRSSSK